MKLNSHFFKSKQQCETKQQLKNKKTKHTTSQTQNEVSGGQHCEMSLTPLIMVCQTYSKSVPPQSPTFTEIRKGNFWHKVNGKRHIAAIKSNVKTIECGRQLKIQKQDFNLFSFYHKVSFSLILMMNLKNLLIISVGRIPRIHISFSLINHYYWSPCGSLFPPRN